MAQKTQHYWRIQKRVTNRVWADLPRNTRDQIAKDVSHDTELTKWFIAKVHADTERLYLDPSYFDNNPDTFKYAKE